MEKDPDTMKEEGKIKGESLVPGCGVCNRDYGDPGSASDPHILESCPRVRSSNLKSSVCGPAELPPYTPSPGQGGHPLKSQFSPLKLSMLPKPSIPHLHPNSPAGWSIREACRLGSKFPLALALSAHTGWNRVQGCGGTHGRSPSAQCPTLQLPCLPEPSFTAFSNPTLPSLNSASSLDSRV